MTNVEVFFDYTCAFSDRGRHRLDALEDTTLVWWPFALLEQDARGGGPPVFGRAEHPDDPWLSALAVHEQVRSQGEDTPTLVLGPGQVVSVELDSVPAIDRAWPLGEAVGRLAGNGRSLRKWQRIIPLFGSG